MKKIAALILLLLPVFAFCNDSILQNYSLGQLTIDKIGRKNCSVGKPCGNTCINKNYVCHVDDPVSTIYTPTVYVNKSPYALFNANTYYGTKPLTVVLDASSSIDSDGYITNYTWSVSDGRTGSGSQVSFTFYEIGTYTILLKVTDNNNSVTNIQKSVTVIAPEPVVITNNYKSEYLTIQWNKRGGDNDYCLDILDDNGNFYDGLHPIQCGKNMLNFLPMDYVHNVMHTELPKGFVFRWKVWSRTADDQNNTIGIPNYAGDGYEGRVIVE